MSQIGPALPSHLRQSAGNGPDDSDDEYGPTLPPEIAAKRSNVSASSPESKPAPSRSPPPRRAVGPSFPTRPPPGNEDSDDDEVGPMPPPASGYTPMKDAVQEFIEREERRRKDAEDKLNPKKLKREEWMLAPPSASDLLGSLDPKKLRQAKKAFSAATSTSRDTKVDNTLWTETPAERQARLAEEISGKRKRATNAEEPESAQEAADKKRRREMDEAIAEGVAAHNRSARDKSLVDMHAMKTKKDGEEEGPLWDHARDMSVGGRLMDERQRSAMISDARGLGERFGSGKGGRYAV